METCGATSVVDDMTYTCNEPRGHAGDHHDLGLREWPNTDCEVTEHIATRAELEAMADEVIVAQAEYNKLEDEAMALFGAQQRAEHGNRFAEDPEVTDGMLDAADAAALAAKERWYALQDAASKAMRRAKALGAL